MCRGRRERMDSQEDSLIASAAATAVSGHVTDVQLVPEHDSAGDAAFIRHVHLAWT